MNEVKYTLSEQSFVSTKGKDKGKTISGWVIGKSVPIYEQKEGKWENTGKTRQEGIWLNKNEDLKQYATEIKKAVEDLLSKL